MSTTGYLLNDDAILTTLGTGSFTLAFWYKPDATGPYLVTKMFLAKAWEVYMKDDGTIAFLTTDSAAGVDDLVSGGAIINDWNFIAVSWDATTKVKKLYLNDASPVTSTLANGLTTSAVYSSHFQLSTPDLQDSSSIPASFGLDETTVWGRVLTDTEVALLYNLGAGLTYPFLGGPISLIYQGKLINTPATPFVFGAGGTLYNGSRSQDSDQNFLLSASPIYLGTTPTNGYVWHADDFYNRVLLAQHDNPALSWLPTDTVARLIPGLPSDDNVWDGVTSFFGHALLWKDDRLKWSDKDNFALWIPVGTTAVSAVLNVKDQFTQPAVGGTVSVQVSDPNANIGSISLSGSGLAFGSVAVGQTAEAILTISNTGTVPITVTGLTYSDPAFSGAFSGTIDVNQSAAVVVTFAPTEARDYNGTVTTASNATSGTPSLAFSGTGTGSTKVINLTGYLDFGNCLTGRTLTSAVVVHNSGNATLTISAVSLPTGYTTTYTPGTVSAGATIQIPVTFAPSAKTGYSGFITVTSDATDGVNSIAVSGNGVTSMPSPTVFITDKGLCQYISTPTSTPVTITNGITIYNPTGNAINVIGVTPPSSFWTGTFSGSIAAHSSASFNVSFDPTSVGDFGGTFSISFKQTVAGRTSVDVTGTGTQSGKVIEVDGVMDFGPVVEGSSAVNLLTIKNVGGTALTVSSVSYATGTHFSGNFAGVVNPGETKYVLITFSPNTTGAFSDTLTVNSDATVPAVNVSCSGTGTATPAVTTLTAGQFVYIVDTRDGVTYYNYYTVVSQSGATVVLKLMDLTGTTAAGLPIDTTHQIFTVDANESGETRVVGGHQNGPIYRVIPQGDYAFVWKERSISTIQYVGLQSGIFFIHPEVGNEGLISREAVTLLNDGRFVFLGHKELYQYQGGPSPDPVCQQYTRQLYKELDRTRLWQIRVFNNELKNEVWVVYPTIGGNWRVLIWNWMEDTATLDDYDPSVRYTALGIADWSADPTWGQLSPALTWEEIPVTWQDWVGASSDRLTIVGSDDGNLRVHGLVYNREGEGYLSLSETMDFDLGDADRWKYVDTVVIGLDVQAPDTQTRELQIQVGSQASLSGKAITWTAAKTIRVDGNATIPVKVNPGGSGRYLRLRFSNSAPDVQWRVVSFEIHCRAGGLY